MKSGAGSTQKMPSFSQAGFLELKKRLLFVVFGLVIFRLGAHIPIPGVDIIKLTALFGTQHLLLCSFYRFHCLV